MSAPPTCTEGSQCLDLHPQALVHQPIMWPTLANRRESQNASLTPPSSSSSNFQYLGGQELSSTERLCTREGAEGCQP